MGRILRLYPPHVLTSHTLGGAMIVAAKSHQDNLAWGQHTSTLTLNPVLPSTINLNSFNITHVRYPRCVDASLDMTSLTHCVFLRDSTSHQSASIAIVNALSCFGSLLLVAALAYYLWKVRQGRIHPERISLAHFLPRMSIFPSSPYER